MYKQLSNLHPPSNSLQRLWRYFKYEHFVDLLSSETLYFVHLPTLSDGLEGALTNRSRDRLFRHFYYQYGDAATAEGSIDSYEDHKNAFFVNCWHMNDGESYLMWKAYAERGLAIRTTYERICISFDDFAGEVNGSVVEYVDFECEEFSIGNVYTAVVAKDKPYLDEREFRLLLWRPEFENPHLGPPPAGTRVAVDLKRLVERIYVSPKLRELPQEGRKLLEDRGLSEAVASSRVFERPGFD